MGCGLCNQNYFFVSREIVTYFLIKFRKMGYSNKVVRLGENQQTNGSNPLLTRWRNLRRVERDFSCPSARFRGIGHVS